MIAVPKYGIGDFVYKGKVCDENIVQISDVFIPQEVGKKPRYAIWYTQNQVIRDKNEIGTFGGGSSSWSEDDFTQITDPHLLLIIRKHALHKAIRSCEVHLKEFNNDLSKINYALDVVNPPKPKEESEDENK